MKVIILEANEIPPRLFQHYAKLKPNSCIANILDKTPITETVADDVEDRLKPGLLSTPVFRMKPIKSIGTTTPRISNNFIGTTRHAMERKQQ